MNLKSGTKYRAYIAEIKGELKSIIQAGLNYVKQAHSYSKIAHQLEARLEKVIEGKKL